MSRTIKFLTIIIITLLAAIILGMSIPKRNDYNLSKELAQREEKEEILDDCTDEYENMEEVAKTNSEEEKLSPNCKMVLKKFYRGCGDSINEYMTISEDLVNCTKEELSKLYKDWQIKDFSIEKVELYKEFDGECGEHYILKNEDGKIVIYKRNKDGEETQYENTDVSVDYLPDDDKKMLENGLKVNGREKLNKLIESFE